jgi:hypothetical protein
MNIDFISSNRFWSLVGVVVVSYLGTHNWIEAGLANSLIALGLGFIGIATADKVAEKVGGK